MTIPHLNSLNPWDDLKNDPYAFEEVFSPEMDFKVVLAKEITEHNILIFEKKCNGIIEIAFVMCVSDEVNTNMLKILMRFYKQFVLSLPNKNFREVEPIIIAHNFKDEVIQLIKKYNLHYEKRKPLRIFTFG